MNNDFIQAIHDKHKIKLTFFSKEDNHNLTRLCAPMDYGVSNIRKDGRDYFHFWDYESDSEKGAHPLFKTAEEISTFNVTSESFDPGEFVKWSPKWIIPRDWAEYS